MATVSETFEMTGPNIIGMRITVYHLVPYFLKPNYTEQQIQELYPLLSLQQVAAARAYFLANYEAVMKRHLEIEARNAAGNSPETKEWMERAHRNFQLFREWRATLPADQPLRGEELMQAFREWKQQQDVKISQEGSS